MLINPSLKIESYLSKVQEERIVPPGISDSWFMRIEADHNRVKMNDIGAYKKQFGDSIDGLSHFLQRNGIRTIYRDVSYV